VQYGFSAVPIGTYGIQVINAIASSNTMNVDVIPEIQLGLSDITGISTSAVVGQQITLSAVAPLPSGVTIQSQSWVPQGSIVGGFNPATIPQKIDADLSQSSASFYWFDTTTGQAATTYSVVYTATLSDGTTVKATTNFAVQSPTNAQVAALMGGPGFQSRGTPAKNWLGLGGVPPGYGITFTPSVTSPVDYLGRFVWGQVIDSIVVVWTPTTGTPTTCSRTLALDNAWPYAALGSSPDQRVDSPGVQLAVSGLSEQSYTMLNHMFLMWQPAIQGQVTIPVPLGNVQWGWYGDATFDLAASPIPWNLSVYSWARPIPTPFVPSSIFPSWSAVFNNPADPSTLCPGAPGIY
jgi:hypothetical protein